MTKAIHFKCEIVDGRPRNMNAVRARKNIYDSGYWAVSEEEASIALQLKGEFEGWNLIFKYRV